MNQKKYFLIITLLLTCISVFLWPLSLNQNTKQKWVFYDKNNEVLYSEKLFFEPEEWENEFLEKALIQLEDKNFYNHYGVDFLALMRASSQNLQEKKIVSGASTLTMQLGRLFFLESEKRNFWYKIRQIFYALKLESQLDKKEILRQYLGRVSFGNGALGVSAASQKYFSKTPSNLSLGETVLLLSIIQNPSAFDPISASKKSIERQKFLLKRLREDSIISQEDFDFWTKEKVKLSPKLGSEIIAPHFVFWVRNNLKKQYFKSSEVHVYTTLDKNLYQTSLKILRETLKRQGKEKHVTNGSIVVLDHDNKIKVMLGSLDFFDKNIDGAVSLATSPRQTGSVLKPFLYAFSLDEGFSPNYGLRDEKQIFDSGYFPRNFNINEENGIVRFREALANSYNIAAVDLLRLVGLEKFYNFCQKIELNFNQSSADLGLSFILGSGESSLLNLSRAYSIFPNKGELKLLQFVRKVEDEDKNILIKTPLPSPSSTGAGKQIMGLDSAEWGINVLSDDEARWKNFSRGNSLELPFASAAKTGTSQGFRDNWVLGFSPQYTVGVWVGNSDGSAMRSISGMQGAGPVWQKIMAMLHDGHAVKKFSYQGSRKEKIICRRPDQKACNEKVKVFLLPEEEHFQSKPPLGLTSDFQVTYPKEGDIFLSGSDLLIQVRGDTGKVSYFFDGDLLNGPIVEGLRAGKHQVQVQNGKVKKEIKILVQ